MSVHAVHVAFNAKNTTRVDFDFAPVLSDLRFTAVLLALETDFHFEKREALSCLWAASGDVLSSDQFKWVLKSQ